MTKRSFNDAYGSKVEEIIKGKLTVKQKNEIVDAFFEAVKEGMEKGKVQITGQGTFEKKEMAQRVGRNPKTGVEIVIPAKAAIKFKAGSKFKK